MFVMTIDQRRSSQTGSRAKKTLTELTERHQDSLLLPIGRFAGDELQLILDDPMAVRTIAVSLIDDNWHVGIGVGTGTLGSDAADSTGAAFTLAREAVDAAKSLPWHVAIRSIATEAAEDAEAALALVQSIRSRRTEHGAEIVALVRALGSVTAAAAQLDISVSAASKRARIAMLRHEDAGLRLADRLLTVVSDDAVRL